MKNRRNHRKQSDYCHQSGKKRFRDPREATARLQSLLNQARLLDEQGKDHTIHVVRKYRCNACRGWHLTSWENYGAPQDEAPPAPAVPASRDPLMISLATSLKRTRTAKKGTLRAQDMCDRRAAGETLDQIGKAYGVTRERVRQIIKAAGGPTRSEVKNLKAKRQAKQDAEDATRLRKLMHQHPGRTRAELAELSGVPFNRIGDLLGEDTRFLVTPQTAREQFSDEDIVRAMRAAAARFDRPLSHTRYATVAAEVGGPSVPRIIQRFGTWLKACEAAGVRPGGKGRGNYVRRWTKTEILNWVAVYLQSDGCDGTYAGYDRWARTTAGAPSSATMRTPRQVGRREAGRVVAARRREREGRLMFTSAPCWTSTYAETQGEDVDNHTETPRDLYAPAWVSADQEPDDLFSQIVPGLFQGGTPLEHWSSHGISLDHHEPDPIEGHFDAVVSLFAWSRPCDWGVEELRYGFPDAHPQHADMSRVVRAARWAYDRWTAGDRVLIRCQAGLNRSGLVTAMVLMLDGWSAEDAIRQIRRQRAEVALVNDDFVDWLVHHAPTALGETTPSAA